MSQEEQQNPTTDQELPSDEESPKPENVDLKKAFAKEDLANLTSGAKEKFDKTRAGMKGAAHIMTHPFNKQAKEEAKAKVAEQKNEIGQKQQSIRETARIQLMEQKAIADGVDPASVQGLVPGPSPQLVPGQGAQLVQGENSDSAMQEASTPGQGAQLDNEENSDSAMQEASTPGQGAQLDNEENSDSAIESPEDDTEPTSGEPINETEVGERENQTEPSSGAPSNEAQISSSEGKTAEETSDSSSRGRSGALNQISPDSKDYQSG